MNAASKRPAGQSPTTYRAVLDVAIDTPSEPPKAKQQESVYRPLSAAAVLSVVFGAFSWLSALHWAWGLLPLLGTALALWAWRRISRAPEELCGLGLAKAGLGLSLGLWAAGWLVYYFFVRSDVPQGYTLITFEQLQPDPSKPGQLVAPLAVELEENETRVFIRGYIYPGRQATGIKKFVLVPTIGHCAFCRTQLRSTEMIRVELTGDLATHYKSTLVGVGGKLDVDPAAAATPYGGFPYQLQADCIR